ncbi:MAG TPA: SprT family zinc-dependent metalloprotease [Caulobacteraceae bacterium]
MALFGQRHQDGERIEIAGLTVRLSVNARARRISLRIDRVRREPVAVAPSLRRLSEAVAFARRRADWMAERIAELAPPISLKAGDEVQIFGQPCRLAPDGRRPRLALAPGDGSWILSGCGVGRVDIQLVARAIRGRARTVFAQRIACHCAALGVLAEPALRLGDARGRWGSCTPARRGRPASIRLSWRLALAPFEVADYVAAHECAHLIEAHHGPAFWTLVRALVGDEKPHRAWLTTEGPRLHAIGQHGGPQGV